MVMNTFNVNLNICECIYCNNCKECHEREVNVTNSTQTIRLKCGFLLNVIAVNGNVVTVLIQNGFQVIIRNIRNFQTQLCIPNNSCTQILTLCANVIS